MKKKKTIINVTELFKKALEKEGFTVELYSDKFNPDRKGEKLLTLGFMPRFLIDGNFHYGGMLSENIISVEGESINILHEVTDHARMPHIAVYSHKELNPGEPLINKYGPAISVAQEGMVYEKEKDKIKFSLHAPKILKHANGFGLWHDFVFKIEYSINKDIQKIVDSEMKKLKAELAEMRKKEEVKNGRISTNA
jgi:hypothetical protein